ncbi:uncharacterized protein RSE6_02246 [Rhynchosporium secalis]|uniref:Uncharacterized protein n=1 Tax=Rhynchosporium secalis TaxID=38038 RepID=A0A1E1LZT2_RHYSE|nr:uncharacterized protein RSE6_02246 [Rhynchosporium secalis]
MGAHLIRFFFILLRCVPSLPPRTTCNYGYFEGNLWRLWRGEFRDGKWCL